MSHVDEGRLHAWLDYGRSGMTEAEYVEVGAHLARCAECAALLAEERALRERASAILGGTGPRATTAPAFEALAERARASGQLPVPAAGRPARMQGKGENDRSGRRNRRSLVGLAWAASLVAALGLGWAASTLMDREQVAIQSEASLQGTEAGAPANSASQLSERVSIDAAADQAAPEMAGPPSVGAPVVDRGRLGYAAMAAPPPSAAAEEGASSASTAAAAATSIAGNEVAYPSVRSAAGDGQRENVIISGVVRNTDGAPIAGANVSLRGTGFATVSRQNGAYEFTVPANAVAGGATLLVSTLGFAEVETPLSAQGSIAFQDFRLAPAALNLEELVAVGYGQQARATASGRAESVTPESVADRPSLASTSAQPAAAPAAPPVTPSDLAGIAITPALGLANQPTVIWSVVTAEQAGQRLGRAILIHPGFPLLRIEMPSNSELSVVRVVHALPGSGNLTITQSRLVAGQPSQPTPPGSASLIRGDLVVTGAGPISADSITTLLQGLR